MFINENESPIATIRSTGSERLGMWICTACIILLGLVSYVYDYILEMASAVIA